MESMELMKWNPGMESGVYTTSDRGSDTYSGAPEVHSSR